MSVLISNPERKKERTDADANEKEIYVAGLNKFTTKEDLMKLFKTVSQDSTYFPLARRWTLLLSMVQSRTSEWPQSRTDNQKVSLSWNLKSRYILSIFSPQNLAHDHEH
jgi:hypothetical protein